MFLKVKNKLFTYISILASVKRWVKKEPTEISPGRFPTKTIIINQ